MANERETEKRRYFKATVELEKGLYTDIKLYAIRHGMSVKRFMNEAVAEALEKMG